MIELYTAGTANGQKVSIMLEECGLPYNPHIVNFAAGEHLSPPFITLNPAGHRRSRRSKRRALRPVPDARHRPLSGGKIRQVRA
jgi:hypothetical protein